jgi:uncharacterized membrane protein (TIGR02234 family)
MAGSRRLAVLLTLVGAGLILLAATRPWAGVQVSNVPGVSELTVSGRRASPAAIPVALAAAAGAIVLATSGRIVRALVAVGLVFAGTAFAVSSVRISHDASSALASALRDSLGLVSHRRDGQAFGGSFSGATVQITGWPWVATAGGLLVVIAGLLTLVKGWTWPVPGRRFERPDPAVGTGADSRPVSRPVTTPRAAGSAGTWDALSRGEDPTSNSEDPT